MFLKIGRSVLNHVRRSSRSRLLYAIRLRDVSGLGNSETSESNDLPPIYACPMSTKMMLLISIVLVSHPLSYINIVAAIGERRRERGGEEGGNGRKQIHTPMTYSTSLQMLMPIFVSLMLEIDRIDYHRPKGKDRRSGRTAARYVLFLLTSPA